MPIVRLTDHLRRATGQSGLAEILNMQNVRRAINGITNSGVTSSSPTSAQLASQWTNPSDVLSVLLIIGGDIVQKALAQTAGGLFTPVCFSFGWVAYSLTALVGIVGDGRLLPEPDYPVKVFNLQSGYARENKNWIIGRILRDNAIHMAKTQPLHGGALRIAIYEAKPNKTSAAVAGSGRVRFFGVLVILLQLGIAAIPVGLYDEWGVLMITAIGTLLALVAGALPQWAAEKLPQRRKSNKNFALTSGNGSRDIMIVLGNGNSLDLEELAMSEMPRSTRLWESVPFFSRPVKENKVQIYHRNGTPVREALSFQGIPLGFWATIAVTAAQSICWLAFLITVAGLRSHAWYLLLVGTLGMFQNAIVAAISRRPEKRSLPLMLMDTITSRTVMDGLMDLEVTYPSSARRLLHEFFPGELRPDESAWWNGDTATYDKKREAEGTRRGMPRSLLPRYASSVTSVSILSEKRPTMPRPPLSAGKESTRMSRSPFRDPSVVFERTKSPLSHDWHSESTDDVDGNTPVWRGSYTASSRTTTKTALSTKALAHNSVGAPSGTDRDFEAPDRKDTGSSGASVDDAYKLVSSPDWAG